VIDMLQLQLAHTEAQCFALVQNVAEMRNQVVNLEVEVEVWQAMTHQGQQPPIVPPVAPATPDELQGASCLSEDSVTVCHPLLLRLVLAPLRATSLPSCCSREKSCTLDLAFSSSFCGRF
jgi:hypothetical protein